jgi:translation initiation factor 2B subunit (eIF-2B alpha/beta/delta family)
MARRTIRARRASPYLLYLVIGFSILMVAGFVAAGWLYSLRNEERTKTFGLERLRQAAEEKSDPYRKVFDMYPEAGNTLVDIIENRSRVVDEYKSEIQRLTERLVGDPFNTQQGNVLRQSVSDVIKSTSDVLAQASQTLQKSYQVGTETGADVRMTSMQAAIRSLMQRIDALVLLVNQDATNAATLETQVKGLQDELKAAKDEHARQVAQLQQDLKDEKARLSAARDSAIAQSQQSDKAKQLTEDRLIADRRQAAAEKEKLERQALTLQNDLKEVSGELAGYRKVPTETGVDGHIVSVAEQGTVAYGDLGRKDGVLLGMTFSIFSPTELGKNEPKPKAQCRIVKIMQDACELRVFQLQGANPVVSGDVLLNPVYDRERRLRFVLVGKMDIDGDGMDDTEQLKALIQEFGGRIDTTLTVQTDYLVIGEQPAVPAAPSATDGPGVRQKYEEGRKQFIEYTEAIAKAENFNIPVLSLNRFLGLVGLAGQG